MTKTTWPIKFTEKKKLLVVTIINNKAQYDFDLLTFDYLYRQSGLSERTNAKNMSPDIIFNHYCKLRAIYYSIE